MFKDQILDNKVYNLDKKLPSDKEYSPTGNSWNQSDIDSEYHRFDPKRYAARPEPV